MRTKQLINALRCDDMKILIHVASEAAEMLELLEERLAIMSEDLTEQEWEAQQEKIKNQFK